MAPKRREDSKGNNKNYIDKAENKTFEKAKGEFTKLHTEYSLDKELPREDLARLKQNSIEVIADFDRLSQDKTKTSLQKRIVEKLRTDSVEDLQDISEAEEKFSDKPYEALNEAHTSFRRRARAEQPDSFTNEVDKLLGNIKGEEVE